MADSALSATLFEDTNWMSRWLVVDTGNWLSGRNVLLPPSVLEQPDAGRRQFPIKLTMVARHRHRRASPRHGRSPRSAQT
jgi:hypothetical protein